jgi:hypothetical protein
MKQDDITDDSPIDQPERRRGGTDASSLAKDSPPDEPEPLVVPSIVYPVRHTVLFLLTYYAIGIVWGVRNVWFWRPSFLDLLTPILLCVCLGWWAVVDARLRSRPIPITVKPWFVLLAPLVVPGYVIWSRRWRGVGWAALHAFCWYALGTLTMHTGGTIVFGRAWWRAMGFH